MANHVCKGPGSHYCTLFGSVLGRMMLLPPIHIPVATPTLSLQLQLSLLLASSASFGHSVYNKLWIDKEVTQVASAMEHAKAQGRESHFNAEISLCTTLVGC